MESSQLVNEFHQDWNQLGASGGGGGGPPQPPPRPPVGHEPPADEVVVVEEVVVVDDEVGVADVVRVVCVEVLLLLSRLATCCNEDAVC